MGTRRTEALTLRLRELSSRSEALRERSNALRARRHPDGRTTAPDRPAGTTRERAAVLSFSHRLRRVSGALTVNARALRVRAQEAIDARRSWQSRSRAETPSKPSHPGTGA